MGKQYHALESAGNILTSHTTTASATNTFAPVWTRGGAWYHEDLPLPAITQIIREREVTKGVETRTLFRVYVVDPRKKGKILMDGKAVIAINENQAMLKAGVAEVAEKEGLDLEQVDVYVQTIGTFIRPRRETQKVRITEDPEE